MDGKEKYAPHRISWTAEHSVRFWDFVSAHPALRKLYFSRKLGDALIRYVRARRIPLSGRILDFGCGPGYLLEKLVAEGVPCEGMDYSQKSLAEARRRIGHNPLLRELTHIKKLPTPLPDGVFDAVFLIETIEHLLDQELDLVASEMFRIIKPGGVVIITTPNEENLPESEILCPECGCIFHRWQHVRSWGASGLSSWISGFGFDRETCRAVYLPEPTLASNLRVFETRILRRKLPHLVYIGRKRG